MEHDETVYMLDLPDVKKSTVDLAFNVMGDFADGALLTAAEIDEERGVISSEKTSRDSIQMRMTEKQFKYLLPKSIIALGRVYIIAIKRSRKNTAIFVCFLMHQVWIFSNSPAKLIKLKGP